MTMMMMSKQKKIALDILLGPEDEKLTAPSAEEELKQFMSEPQIPKRIVH